MGSNHYEEDHVPDPRRLCVLLAVWGSAFLPPVAPAAEIPGAPVAVPLSYDPELYVHWGNDSFGKGGREDDFRTQQTILNARVAERWLLALDHSILTRGSRKPADEPFPGRIDQLSASLGYIIHDRAGRLRRRLSAGLGVRVTGNFDGDNIQNGFHRLSSERIIQLDYVDSDEVLPTGWVKGGLQHTLLETGPGRWGSWDLGYWVDGTLLATTDGQLDGSGGLFAIVENGGFRFWTGVRGDLRQGHSQDPVQSATADAEEGYFYVVGITVGPLLLKTAQALGSDTQSFGNIGIAASEAAAQPIDNRRSAAGVQVSLLIPDIQVNTQLRYAPASLNAYLPPGRRLNLIAGFRYGEPTYDDSETASVEIKQAAFQVELESQTDALGAWIKPYASFGLGLRQERLVDTSGAATARSGSVERGVAVADAGVRFDAAGRRGAWSLQVKLGLSGWLPFSEQQVVVNGTRFELQQPGAALSAGITTSVIW